MADFGRLLISKVVIDKDLITAMSSGVRVEWFEDAEHAAVYGWMQEYFSRYGKTPTVRATRSQFPNYRLIRADEPYAYYVDQLREQRKRAIIVNGVVEAGSALDDGDHRKAEEALADALMQIGREANVLNDMELVETINDRLRDYRDNRSEYGELTGVATGFPTLDMITSGFHSEQFILLGGGAKQGKSFLMMKMAMAAQQAGCRVLFVSFEMSQYEQHVRYDAIQAQVNSMRLLHRTQTDEELKRLTKMARLRKSFPAFYVSADASATTTLSALAAKIETRQPDIVFVDGAYLMEPETKAEPGSAQAYTTISRGLKRLAQRTKLPVVGSTQALSSKMGRDGAVTMHSLGWTSAWSQDADLILGVEHSPPFIRLRVVAGRNVSPREISINCNWDRSELVETEEQPDDEAE